MAEVAQRPVPTWKRFMDALRGCEGRRIPAARLRAFYEQEYVQRNPELDAQDAAGKADALAKVFTDAALPRPRRLLEVGCGSGSVLAELTSRLEASRSLGIDYGMEQARTAAACTRAPMIVATGSSLPISSGSCDLAYVADVLEHVAEPERVLREMGRVASYVGFLIPIEAGLIASPLYAYRGVRGEPTNFEQYGHIWRWFRREAYALISRAGLSLVSSAICHAARKPDSARTVWGRAVATAQSVTFQASESAAELLFGGVTWVGIARAGSAEPGQGVEERHG